MFRDNHGKSILLVSRNTSFLQYASCSLFTPRIVSFLEYIKIALAYELFVRERGDTKNQITGIGIISAMQIVSVMTPSNPPQQ